MPITRIATTTSAAYEVPVHATVTIPEDDILDLIDTAGYGIGYWARSARVDEEAREYIVAVRDPEEVPLFAPVRRLKFEWIAKRLVQLDTGHKFEHNGREQVGPAIRRYAAMYIGSIFEGTPDPGFIDSDLADVIVQLCYFEGEVVFG